MKWEKLENGKWRLITPKGKIDPYDPRYSMKLKSQMKKINLYCDTCKTTYNLANPCIHHLSDSPEHRAMYKAYQQGLKNKRETVRQDNTQIKL